MRTWNVSRNFGGVRFPNFIHAHIDNVIMTLTWLHSGKYAGFVY